MGGRISRSSFVLMVVAALLVSGIATPVAVEAKEKDDPTPAPSPATESEVRVQVDWEHKKDLLFEYLLTNWPAPLVYPYDGDVVSNIGGCPGKELGGPMTPLVLSESLISNHLRGSSGYSLVVTAQGVCSTHDYSKQVNRIEKIGKAVEVRATVEYWAPGDTAPYRTRELGPIKAPIFVQESNHGPYRRKFDVLITLPTGSPWLESLPAPEPEDLYMDDDPLPTDDLDDPAGGATGSASLDSAGIFPPPRYAELSSEDLLDIMRIRMTLSSSRREQLAREWVNKRLEPGEPLDDDPYMEDDPD